MRGGTVSTIDPARVKRERDKARQGSIGAAIGVILGNLLIFVGGVSGGWATGGRDLLGGFRDRALNHFFADSPVWAAPSWLDLAALPASVVVPLIGMFLLTTTARAYTGQVMSFPVVGPVTVWLAGFAAGIAAVVSQWPPPLTVGMRIDPVFGDDEVWSSGDWAWYRADEWIPWVAVALAFLSLVLGIVARARKAAHRRDLDRLIVEGQRALGDVTAIPTITEGGALLAPWTVHFVDRSLTDRWVTSSGKFPRDDLPKVGDHVTVLYDAAAPGDKRRIYIGGIQASTAEDFLRWRL